MGSVIVVMPKIEDAKKMAGMLKARGLDIAMACSLGSEALQAAEGRDYGVIVSGFRMRDMNHIELLGYMPKYYEMVLLTSESKLDSCSKDVKVVTLPLHVPTLVQEIDNSLSRIEKQLRYDKKGPGSRSEEDRAIIENAQAILLKSRGLERIAAYRYIQKRSMDSCCNMVEMATRIIQEEG